MSIRDNGFTFSKKVIPLEISTGAGGGYEFVKMTGSLSQIKDWLIEALDEIDEKIEEIG